MLPSKQQIIKGGSPQMVSMEMLEKKGTERKTSRKPSQRKEMEIFKTLLFQISFFLSAVEEQLQSWHISAEVMKHFCTTALAWHLIDHIFPSFCLAWFPHQKHYPFKINHPIYTCLDLYVTVSIQPLSLLPLSLPLKAQEWFCTCGQHAEFSSALFTSMQVHPRAGWVCTNYQYFSNRLCFLCW